MAVRSLLLFFLISSLLAFNLVVATASRKEADDLDLDEDLSILESSDDDDGSSSPSFPHEPDHDSLEEFDHEEFEGFDPDSYEDGPPMLEIDDKDVVILPFDLPLDYDPQFEFGIAAGVAGEIPPETLGRLLYLCRREIEELRD